MEILKDLIQKEILLRLQKKLENLNFLIDTTTESRDMDLKSSVGDKHETSRAKIQNDLDHYYSQLMILESQINILNKINLSINYNKVAQGALIETNKGIFFISTGIGKMVIENKTIFAVSMISPIGMAMKGKRELQSFNFRNILYTINRIS